MSPQVEPVVVAGAAVSWLTTAICLAEAGHEVTV
jgi:2-polyprenyl-6-methoxyphenol hydroxylase-like FAD-dependent oxidoreductase